MTESFREVCYDDLLAYTNALLDAIHESKCAKTILNNPNVVFNCNAFSEVVRKQIKKTLRKKEKQYVISK